MLEDGRREIAIEFPETLLVQQLDSADGCNALRAITACQCDVRGCHAAESVSGKCRRVPADLEEFGPADGRGVGMASCFGDGAEEGVVATEGVCALEFFGVVARGADGEVF